MNHPSNPHCLNFRTIVLPVASLCSVHRARAENTPPELRQFDFWIGEWEVTGAKGKVAGRNRIERMTELIRGRWRCAMSDSIEGRMRGRNVFVS